MYATIILAAATAIALSANEPTTNIADIEAASLRAGTFCYNVTGTVSGIIHGTPELDYMFISDASGCAFFAVPHEMTRNAIAVGDVVRAQGERLGGRNNHTQFPLVTPHVERLGRGEAPQPVRATVREIANGGLDFHLVRTTGLVRNVSASETTRTWATISLFDDGELLRVAVPTLETPVERYMEFIGRRVEVDGFPNTMSGSPRRFAGRSFHAAGLSAIRAIDDPDADPFDAPDMKTLACLTAAQIESSGAVRSRGLVLCTWNGDLALMRTVDGDVVRLVLDTGDIPKCGDSIECVGFPLTDAFHITLVHVKWREAAPMDIAETQPMAATVRMLNGDGVVNVGFHGRMVTLRGKVRTVHDKAGAISAAFIEDEDMAVALHAGAGWPKGLASGCTVEATGVCIMEAKRWHPKLVVPRLRDVAVVVRRPEDLRILRNPPWWTPARFSIVACSLLAALIGLFAWNRALNNLAERRGRRLLAEEIGHVKADLKTAERTRLAVELHDSLTQNLVGVSMEIQAAARYGTDDIDEHMHHLSIADTALKSCLQNLRNTLWDLRSLALNEPDIESAIRRTLLPHVKGVQLSVDFPASRRKMTEQELHEVLRIIRELAINSIRHGSAKSIQVQGSMDGDTMTFSVRDDGCGFDPADCPGIAEGHFGLQGVLDRLRGLHGTLKIDSARGRGTYAEVSIRLQHKES